MWLKKKGKIKPFIKIFSDLDGFKWELFLLVEKNKKSQN